MGKHVPPKYFEPLVHCQNYSAMYNYTMAVLDLKQNN